MADRSIKTFLHLLPAFAVLFMLVIPLINTRTASAA